MKIQASIPGETSTETTKCVTGYKVLTTDILWNKIQIYELPSIVVIPSSTNFLAAAGLQ